MLQFFTGSIAIIAFLVTLYFLLSRSDNKAGDLTRDLAQKLTDKLSKK